jgi:hypothetical protein
MAATVTVNKKYSLGRTGQLVVGSVAFDSSYPTGGEAITIPDAEYVHLLIGIGDGANDYVWDGSASSPKLLSYVASTGVEVANTTDLSAKTAVKFVAITG